MCDTVKEIGGSFLSRAKQTSQAARERKEMIDSPWTWQGGRLVRNGTSLSIAEAYHAMAGNDDIRMACTRSGTGGKNENEGPLRDYDRNYDDYVKEAV